ncbi:hypothetical protein O9993_00370 [Vibrio lentus]|nr:hypothetical protein [Vibrio lentus]
MALAAIGIPVVSELNQFLMRFLARC